MTSTTAELKADMEHYRTAYEEAMQKYINARVAESSYKLGDVYTDGRLTGKIVKFDFSLALDRVDPIVQLTRKDGTRSTRELHLHTGWRRVEEEDEL